MSKLSPSALILLTFFVGLFFSCSSETASTNPGSSTEGTAQLDTLVVHFESSKLGPWEIQIEKLDSLAGLYNIDKKLKQDSLDFHFTAPKNEFFKIAIINLNDSSYYTQNISPNQSLLDNYILNSQVLQQALTLWNPPEDCVPASVDYSPSKITFDDTGWWSLSLINTGRSSIQWTTQDCAEEFPTILLENDTITFIQNQIIDTGSRQIVGIWTFDSNKLQAIPSKGLQINITGEHTFGDGQLLAGSNTYLEIQPVMGVNQAVMKTYSYTMIVDFTPLDTGWFPLFALDSLNKPDFPKVWINTQQGIFSEDRQNQIKHNFSMKEATRLTWVSDQAAKTITWYINGIEIGKWSGDLFYEIDLGVHLDEKVYLFGAYNDSGIPFKLKALYNFNDKLTEDEVAQHATYKANTID